MAADSIGCIFSINPGRCGSEYLKSLFEHAVDCQAFHEPEPKGNGQAMRRFAQGDIEPMRQIAAFKAEAIEQVSDDGRVYVETNHCFIKGFGWFIPGHFPEERIGVIVLKRDASQVVNSLLRVGCSPLTRAGRNWVTTPDKKNPLVPPPSWIISPRVTYLLARGARFLCRASRVLVRAKLLAGEYSPRWLAEYERNCLHWYVAETHAQAELFQRQFPEIRYYEADLSDLNSPAHVREMLAYFGLRGDTSLHEVVGRPTNLKRSSEQVAA